MVVLLLIVAGVLWLRWKEGEVCRSAIQTLGRLDTALRTGNSADLLSTVCLPAAIQGRTGPEQAEFLTKALADEISPEGLAVLQQEGAFGPLTNLFPVEAADWAKQAGVKPEDCLAFKLERNGLRAEAVLARESNNHNPASGVQHPDSRIQYRIVRLNNVKQLAQGPVSTANSHP